VDLSDDDPEIIARLLVCLYSGGHVDDGSKAILARLLDRDKDTIIESTLPLEAKMIAVMDKYQMPDTLVNDCKRAYIARVADMWNDFFLEEMTIEFIDSVKIIYQMPPSAGLRGRATTTAQYSMVELQHRPDFRELMLSIPEFALDVATKGLRQALWCKSCATYMEFPEGQPPVANKTKCDKIWDWIDYAKPQDWTDFACRFCGEKGRCTEVRPECSNTV
jgi:hypothetical protein